MKTIKNTTLKYSKFKHIPKHTIAYLAGIIDANANLGAQIVFAKNKTYQFDVKVYIRFHEHKERAWFLYWIGKTLKHGTLTKRKSAKWDWTIYSQDHLKDLLLVFTPYLRLKRRVAMIIIDIIDSKKRMQTKADLLKVMRKVDRIAQHTNSKPRIWTSLTARHYWKTGEKPQSAKSVI